MTDTKHSAELATCDFCRASEVPVRRKYLYRENKEREIGDGFTITRYCHECGLKSENADTNHTDSVEVSYLTDIAIEVWNQNCDKSAPEAMRAVVTALQAHTSQQVEEAVRNEREFIYRHIVSEEARNIPYDTEWKQGYLSGIDDIAVYIKNLLPNHHDNT